MTMLRPVSRDAAGGPADGRVLRIALVLDPASQSPTANRIAPAGPGVDVHLHLAEPAFVTAREPFLKRMDVLIIEIDVARPAQFDDFARLARELTGIMPVIAAGRGMTVADTRRLIRAGAVDVLPLPMSPEDFEHALDAARGAIASRPESQLRHGKTATFVRAIGGVGATALATQAGCLWAETKSVCLVDFDVQFGSAALYLDIKSQLGLVDLIEARDQLDVDLLRSVAMRHESGLHVIAGPNEVMPLDILTPQLVSSILTTASQAFDIILVDLPAAWTTWSLAAVSQSDVVCLVTSLTVPGIHQARRQLDVLDAHGLGEIPTRIILNRVANKFFRNIDLSDTERVLRRKVDFTIANDYPTVSAAVDQGRPLARIKAKSKVEKDLLTMVEGLSSMLVADRG